MTRKMQTFLDPKAEKRFSHSAPPRTSSLMRRVTFSSLLLVLVSLINITSANSVEEDKHKSFQGWTCDEILAPDLCDLTMQTDTVPVKGGIHVRYWKYSPGNQTEIQAKLPVIVVHGGPGFPHSYLLPLKKLACEGRDVFFYDQAGCGESLLSVDDSQSIHKDYPWLLDPSYYALEELPILLGYLGVQKYHILGHSWGTMLAQIFALNSTSHLRDGLASMVLSGCISDIQLSIQQQWDPDSGTLGTLPPFVQERIKTLEKNKAYDSPEYKALDDVLTTYFTCRTAPLPSCYLESVSKINREIYVSMQGASEFTIAGVLSNFNTTGRLHELDDLPILLTSGQYDTIRPSAVEVMHKNLASSERFLFSRSGHVSAIDEAALMNQVVTDFLERVEISAYVQGGFVPQKNVARSDVIEESPTQISLWAVLCTAALVAVVMLVIWLWGRSMPPLSTREYDTIQ